MVNAVHGRHCGASQLAAGIMMILLQGFVGRAVIADTTTGPAGGSAYFPLTAGSTWKYEVTTKVDDKPERPFVQTVSVGSEVTSTAGNSGIPIGDAVYTATPDGVYLVGVKQGKSLTAYREPQKLIPCRPHASDAWSFSYKGESIYSTCLGAQTIKTAAGEFETQCVFSSSAAGSDAQNRRQVYRYFARGVGLVRETETEQTSKPDGTVSTREVNRDLLAFSGGEEAVKAAAEIPPAGSDTDAFATGKKLAMQGDHAGAIAAYDTALKPDPNNATIRAYKAASLLATNQAAAAQQEIDEALKRDSKNTVAWEIAGQIRIHNNDIPGGRSLYEKAARLAPKEAGAIYTDLAAALAARNDEKLGGAIEAALKAGAQADPPSPEALFQLGQSYANGGKPEAKGYLQKYIDVEGKLPAEQRDARKLQIAKQLLRAIKLLNP